MSLLLRPAGITGELILQNIVFVVVAAVFLSASACNAEDNALLYNKHCAECHHKERIGLKAPPLFPDYISKQNKPSKKNPDRLNEVIRDGLPATQMPGYGKKLSDTEIESISKFIMKPATGVKWSRADIMASRKTIKPAGGRMNGSELTNITLVMEKGTKNLALLDGDDLSLISKFYVGDVHGGPKFSYDLKKIYAAARDGLITKYDIETLSTEMTVRAGIYLRSLAVSFDGSVVGIANNLPRNIIFFDNNMKPLREIESPGKIGGFYSVPKTGSFICSFREIPEIWFINTKDFTIKKQKLPVPFEDFSISPAGNYIVGTKRGGKHLYIYDYVEEKVLAKIATDGLPHLASATFWKKGDELFAGVNHIMKPKLTILSLTKRSVVGEIPLPTPGFFVRTHFSTPWLWVDTYGEEIVLIDKNDFSRTKILKPHPGKKALHIEFTKDGKYSLITVLGADGEVAVYDTATLKIVKRIPFNEAMGKYNATTKTYPAYSLGSGEKLSGGKKVYDKYCMGCHHPTLDAFAPAFAEIADKRSEKEIRTHILAPKKSALKLGYTRSSMTRIRLSKKELDDIVEYVKNFKGRG